MNLALVSCRDLPDWEVDDLPLHAALRDRGVRVHTPAWDAPADWEEHRLVVIRTTWDYWDRRDAFVQWASTVADVSTLHNPPEVIRWNTHKSYLRTLEQRGLPLAPTVWIDPSASVDVAALMAERGWRRAFFKPVVGANAWRTLRFDASPPSIANAQRWIDGISDHEGMMLQPYLTTVEEEGEYSIILFDGRVSHGVLKTPQPGDYRVQDDWGASDAPFEPTDTMRDIAHRAIAITSEILNLERPLLYARLDLLRDLDGRLCVNELELVEPSLFFRHSAEAVTMFADAIMDRMA
jgi:glutathione synthase/RimK-type ligase-like ATP-grasp enzyme